jgi:hypothetical protein
MSARASFPKRQVTMTHACCDELIAAFAKLTQLEAEGLRRGDSFAVDDIECALLPVGGPELLICQVDFGLPPPERLEASLRALLERNYLLAHQACCFTMAPGTGHVVCVLVLDVDQHDAQSLADVFEACAAQARDWRRHHFLDKGADEHCRSQRFPVQPA